MPIEGQEPGVASLKGDVNIPLDVYCSLIKCALHNSSLGFQSPLINSRASACDYTIRSTIDSLLKVSGGSAAPEPSGCSTAQTEQPKGASLHKVPPMAKGRLEGGIKDSIDQVKTDLMSHFSLFYDLREHSIADRLEILSQKGPKEEVDKAQESSKVSSAWNEENGRTIKSSIMSMVDGLRSKLEATTQKIGHLEDELERQLGDPNSRVWENDVIYAKEFKVGLFFTTRPNGVYGCMVELVNLESVFSSRVKSMENGGQEIACSYYLG
ncbi:conserved hypothetical protein [Theileria equi strain WA]|uniref:Uncharacterized protein n=1 Tax=Theileria equi strain WA TaxID=1537102 RepID=L1LBE9_THEEQ|nr:conserved hypothetical protein [Theileria equi strain WA]EKX72600.1 conserved hypothetical protein [Theileria equi strain WA]|eukprot:XP_004832052.1 conserved hypothetical protein [Theileria equi strain WA]